MQALLLVATSMALLTKTKNVPDPANPGKTMPQSFLCDIEGNQVQVGLPIYQDQLSGKTVVRIAENIPSATDSASVAQAAAIRALEPLHYCSPDGAIKGWFVPAPDFNERENSGKAA